MPQPAIEPYKQKNIIIINNYKTKTYVGKLIQDWDHKSCNFQHPSLWVNILVTNDNTEQQIRMKITN